MCICCWESLCFFLTNLWFLPKKNWWQIWIFVKQNLMTKFCLLFFAFCTFLLSFSWHVLLFLSVFYWFFCLFVFCCRQIFANSGKRGQPRFADPWTHFCSDTNQPPPCQKMDLDFFLDLHLYLFLDLHLYLYFLICWPLNTFCLLFFSASSDTKQLLARKWEKEIWISWFASAGFVFLDLRVMSGKHLFSYIFLQQQQKRENERFSEGSCQKLGP